MKKTILAALVACIGYANAANMVVSNVALGPGAAGDTLFASKANVPLSSGIVTMGYFTAGFDVNANLAPANWANLVANFTVVTSAVPGTNSSTLGGAFAGYVEAEGFAAGTITTGNPLLGRMLYTFVGGSATLLQSITDPNTGIALFEVRALADDVPFDQTYVANPSLGTVKIGAAGSFEGDAGAGPGTYKTLQLVAVPEPSALLLGALGILGFVRRRR